MYFHTHPYIYPYAYINIYAYTYNVHIKLSKICSKKHNRPLKVYFYIKYNTQIMMWAKIVMDKYSLTFLKL